MLPDTGTAQAYAAQMLQEMMSNMTHLRDTKARASEQEAMRQLDEGGYTQPGITRQYTADKYTGPTIGKVESVTEPVEQIDLPTGTNSSHVTGIANQVIGGRESGSRSGKASMAKYDAQDSLDEEYGFTKGMTKEESKVHWQEMSEEQKKEYADKERAIREEWEKTVGESNVNSLDELINEFERDGKDTSKWYYSKEGITDILEWAERGRKQWDLDTYEEVEGEDVYQFRTEIIEKYGEEYVESVIELLEKMVLSGNAPTTAWKVFYEQLEPKKDPKNSN
jgi:hypothetical protein